MAFVDGKLQDEEIEFFSKYLHLMGISFEKFEEIFNKKIGKV
jgi:hypothetical protein